MGREEDRWYPLIDHPVQRALVEDKVRFKVVPAGRRSGKTERAKRFMVRECFTTPGNYFIAAPTRDQVRRVYWEDMKLLSFASRLHRKPYEADLTIEYPNGSRLILIGLDRPERLEGSFWRGGIIDEIADIKPTAWAENISPALDTVDPNNPGYRPWCWLIGVPDGLNHYYDIAEYAKNANDPDWKFYTWKSSEILPEDVIESAKRRMNNKQFRQEYEASFETATGKIYDDYCPENYTGEIIQPHEQLMWMHDFNYNPMSSAIGVRRANNDLYILDEIVLRSAVARQSAQEFVEKFKHHKNKNVLLYGDPMGRTGEKHGHISDFTEIETVLQQAGWSVTRRLKKSAPAIRDRQNAVRAKICNASGIRSLFVNPTCAPVSHKGLATVQSKEGSTFLEVESEEQHITTAIGYCCDYEWPAVFSPNAAPVKPLATIHYFGRKVNG